VAFSGYSYTRITKFDLSAVGAGAVTLHEDSGIGTQLAYIPIGYASPPQAASVTLWRTPSAVATYRVDGQRVNSNLDHATDVPILPVDFHDLLVYGAMAREYEHMHDERAGVAHGRFDKRLREFKYYLAETATGDGGMFEKPSRLGAWFGTGV
jgi:hypothetical protein